MSKIFELFGYRIDQWSSAPMTGSGIRGVEFSALVRLRPLTLLAVRPPQGRKGIPPPVTHGPK